MKTQNCRIKQTDIEKEISSVRLLLSAEVFGKILTGRIDILQEFLPLRQS